ncbi:MAG: hypothetical protein JWM95_5565 [Gemmatimonadetes bacterium]|nr:hypothetical protein [Gemmatimonadota bacterium]
MTHHIAFEQLCDAADGLFDSVAEPAVREHLAACALCAAQFASLEALGAHASALPREIAPPADLWHDIRAEITTRRAPSRWNVASWRVEQLAAAAIVIAVASSVSTALYVRGPRREAPAPALTMPVLPVSLAREEARYTSNVEALVRALAMRRDSLAPATIATVEQSLRVADSAIAEARDALARDPGNRVLEQLFASNYERKIDLLRRATELTPRT